MRIKGSKAKNGRMVRCPKCRYVWKTKKRGGYICCSMCKRYFKS